MRGEIAVLVGPTGSFGASILHALVAEGLIVVGVGRNQNALDLLADRYGPAFRACGADIGHDDAIQKISSLIDAPVATVVHGVGLPVAGGVVEAEISAIGLACNLKCGGFLRLIRACDAYLRPRSRLIAIGGHYGFEPSPYAMTAGVANAALANIVRQVSLAYGGRGITAHLVSPGPADTERLRRVATDRAQRSGRSLEEELQSMMSESAIGAFTTPAQVSWAVRMLLAPEADALAGSTLNLDSARRRGAG